MNFRRAHLCVLCTCKDILLPCLPHRPAAATGKTSCRPRLVTSSEPLLGLRFLQEHGATAEGKTAAETPLASPSVGGTVRQLSLHTGSIPIRRILSASTKTLRHANKVHNDVILTCKQQFMAKRKKKGKILSLVWHQLAENILFASPSLLQ